jgi:hypothetical protein
MKGKLTAFAVLSVTLAACGSGVSTPDELQGSWGTDCSTPSLRIEETSIHILYPNKEDFDLTEASFDGHTFKATFDSGGKTITDVFVYEANSLRTDQVIVDGKTFNSDKQRMTKCGD